MGLVAGFIPWDPARAGVQRLLPEYDSSQNEFLFVYDQCAGTHLLREIVEILRHLPASAALSALVSSTRMEEARAVLANYGFENLALIDGGMRDLTGWWGRDILQLGTNVEGNRTLFVPWDKSTQDRADLGGIHRGLSSLAGKRRLVELLPMAAEGGNLLADVHRGHGVLFAGSTIAVETRALYVAHYGVDPGDEGVGGILCDALGCDELVWIGPRGEGTLGRQNPFLFHLDMGMTIPAPNIAVVGRCPWKTLDERAHLELLRNEARRTVEALEARGQWPADLDLPRDPSQREQHLEERMLTERVDLQTASGELEQMAEILASMGYQVHRVPAPPERLRRFQSYTNVVPVHDRLLMPIYPTVERAHGWILRRAEGRDRVEIDLGFRDSDFDLEGDNLEALRVYRELVEDVRVVRDYFYMAGGNVHCVLARL